MKKLLLIFLLVSFTAAAQKISDLYGHWKFESFNGAFANQDARKKAVAEAAMTNMFIIFYPDNTYEGGAMNSNEGGTYSMEGNVITLYNKKVPNSKPYRVTLLKAEPESLLLGYAMEVKVKRQPLAQDKVHLARHWELKAIESEDDDPKPQPAGNSVAFNADGSYAITLGGSRENGFWAARDNTEGKPVMILNANGKIKYWPVIRSSEKELVMTLNNKGQQFIFAAK